jgi:hypothetical protein
VSLTTPPGRVDQAVQELSKAVDSLDGYVESSEVTGTASTTDDFNQDASVTLRVPSASFEELRAGLAKVGTVTSSTTSSRDVTGEYVDLEARKRALEASRGAYLTLLAKATTIGETLSVQQAIDGVQIQIEQIEGQRQVLADASDLATLTVSISETGADAEPKPADDESGLTQAAHRSWDRFVSGIEEIVALLGPLALVGLLAGAAYLVVRLTRRLRPTPGPVPAPVSVPSAPSFGPTPPPAPVAPTPGPAAPALSPQAPSSPRASSSPEAPASPGSPGSQDGPAGSGTA